jgi:dihydroxyacetone kinase-like protein
VDLPALAGALEAALAGVQKLGAAREGEKTMVDALAPAVGAFNKAVAEGAPAGEALSALTDAADAGAQATISMQALKGRASYLGPRSVGHEDPGAASTALILHALRDVAVRLTE